MDEFSRLHPWPRIWNDYRRDLRCLVRCDKLLSLDLSWRRGRSLFLRLCFNNHLYFRFVGFCGGYRIVKFTSLLDFIRHFISSGWISLLSCFFSSSFGYLSWFYEVVFKRFLFHETAIVVEFHPTSCREGLDNDEVPVVNNLEFEFDHIRIIILLFSSGSQSAHSWIELGLWKVSFQTTSWYYLM